MLVERIARLQDMVARGESLPAIYQRVIDDAVALVDADVGSLRLIDAEDPSWMVAVATRSCVGPDERWRQRAPISEGISGRVISTGELVAVEDHRRQPAGSRLVPADVYAVVAAPLFERDRVVGSLHAASTEVGRRWTPAERTGLSEYARHVSGALVVARAADVLH